MSWMLRMRNIRPGSQRSLASRILIPILLVVIAAVALVFGVVIFVVLLGAAVVFFGFLYLRSSWLHRKSGSAMRHAHRHEHGRGVTIDGEYTADTSHKNEKAINQ